MNYPEDQHFVAQFHLRRWIGSDKKLQAYRWVYDKFESKRRSPKGVCKQLNMYTLNLADPAFRYKIETELGNLETQAAPIAEKLLKGIIPITSDERLIWTRYLLAQRVRLPGQVEKLSEQSRDIVKQKFGPDYPHLMQTSPEIVEAIPKEATMAFIQDINKNHQAINDMEWQVLDLASTSKRLLTSDQPIIYTSGLGDPETEIIFPISPTKLFLACKSLSLKPAIEICDITNNTIVRMAQNIVVAHDDSQKIFIEARLKK